MQILRLQSYMLNWIELSPIGNGSALLQASNTYKLERKNDFRNKRLRNKILVQ